MATTGRHARFGELTPISATSAFRLSAARDHQTNRRVVLVEALRRTPASEAALRRLALAHTQPPHPALAPTLEGEDFIADGMVVLDVPACVDLDGLTHFGADSRTRATHSEADGFIVTLRDALLASAREPDRDPSSRFIGTLCFGNVLFARDGRFWIVGLGHNAAVQDEHGALVARTRFFQAPEISVGGQASERSDFVAVLMLLRGMLAFVDINSSIARAISGNSLSEDIELVRRIVWIERHVVHASPSDRASVEETIEVSNRVRELIGCRPDPAAFENCVARVLGRALGPLHEATRPALRTSETGAFIERGQGPRVDLSRRTVLARMLVVLVRNRIDNPGASLDVASLCAACWPGERILPSAAANRVYVAISGLRRAGLAEDLEHSPAGYRIATSVECTLVAD